MQFAAIIDNINMNNNNDWSSKIIEKAKANKSDGICLCLSNDLPDWHFQHRGIKHGYRYCQDVNSAISSLTYWHNESINIWMHYIAAMLLFLYFLCRFDFSLLNNDKFDGYLVIVITITGNVVPMFASAFCHNFYCVNKKLHKFCWFFDFWAILTSMLVGGIGYLYFSFYCNPYIVRYGILGYIILYIYFWHWCWTRYSKRLDRDILQPKDRFPEFSFSLSSFITFVSFIPVGIVWLLKEEYINDIDFYNIQFQCTFSPILLSLGVVLFAQGGVPERFTGVLGLDKHIFDMIGHSHQCWHLCTGIVMFGLLDALIQHFELRTKRGCLP